jgi:hypothetical protein
MESILTSIKKMLGIQEDYDHFDADIIMHINTVFMTLTQIGVGPSDGFYIEDDTTTWLEFVPDLKNFQAIKTYMYLKVKLVFDTPTSPTVLEAMTKQANELEWRLNVAAESTNPNGEEEIQNVGV